MFIDQQLASRINEKSKRLQSLRPLSAPVVARLKQQFALEMTYNSNGIEGNSLTLKETAWVIQDGLTIKGKPLKDHLEAKDHYEALEFLYETVEHGRQQTISEVFIRTLHTLVVRETEREEAGKYRTVNVMITSADHTPPDASQVPVLMRDLICWIQKNQKKFHHVELAALVHHKLVNIHPFVDGNGRTARLVMNLILMHEGYPLAIILKNDRRKYYRVLSQADKGNYQPFVRFVGQAVERSLTIYFQAIFPSGKADQRYVPLSVLSNKTPYSPKYLNLLARYGKIEAHKEKRLWMSSKEAIDQYMRRRQRIRHRPARRHTLGLSHRASPGTARGGGKAGFQAFG